MEHRHPLAGLSIELPTPCASNVGTFPEMDVPCRRDAEVACWGPLEAADGSRHYAFMAVCAHHVRPAMRLLKSATPMPDLIEAWKLEVFVEQYGLIVRTLGAEVEPVRLQRVA